MKSKPSFWRGLRKGMQQFGETIAAIVNTLLLLIVYFLGIGITSLCAKIAGKNFLDTTISAATKTYWSELNLKKKPKEAYYRQF